MSRVVNIDIDVELKAIQNGECGMCRVGATHLKNDTCINTPSTRFTMAECNDCGHKYCADLFTECPICKQKSPE